MALGRGFAAYAEGKGRQMSAQYGGTRARERRIAPCTMRHRRSGMSDVSSTRPAGAVRMIGAMAVARPCMESAYSSMLCKNVPGRPGRSSGAPIALERTLSRRTCDGGSAQRGARARTASRRARTCEATCAARTELVRRTYGYWTTPSFRRSDSRIEGPLPRHLPEVASRNPRQCSKGNGDSGRLVPRTRAGEQALQP